MTTSVVIPTFNGLDFLTANLPAVVAIHPDEIIVTDDASTDGSADFVSRTYPHVKLIRQPRNTGFPMNVNTGFTHAVGDIVILLNQDAAPHPQLIKTILPHFTNPTIFAVTFNAQIQSWADASFHHGFLDYKNGVQDGKIHRSFWASGGAAAFRKSIWDELGGLDSIFSPGYYEDLDLGWRSWRSGYQIIWDPGALVTHDKPESTFNATYRLKSLQRIKDRNLLLAHWKNLDADYLPSHAFYLVSRIFQHPGYIVPVIVALLHLPHVIASRGPSKLSTTEIFTKFV